jgi:hypothetical protein
MRATKQISRGRLLRAKAAPLQAGLPPIPSLEGLSHSSNSASVFPKTD